jgi:hypothetical protein
MWLGLDSGKSVSGAQVSNSSPKLWNRVFQSPNSEAFTSHAPTTSASIQNYLCLESSGTFRVASNFGPVGLYNDYG